MARSRNRRNAEVRVLEEGNIYCMYRPRVSQGESRVRGLEDLQRFYIVLSPKGQERYRLIVMPRKQLPAPSGGDQKFWGFVDKVSRNPEEVEEDLDRGAYETETRGERVRPEARPAGEGLYSLVQHQDHTHLVYVLELPDIPGEVQQALNIAEAASYIISVKNPEQPSPEGIGLGEADQARFPQELQGRFKGRRFAQLDPPDFLDYAGAELLFIGTSEDAAEDLGVKLDPQDESEATSGFFTDLRMEKSQHPVEPLLKGKWA